MNRSPLKRGKPPQNRTPLQRYAPLRNVSAKRAGEPEGKTRRSDTGPKQSTRDLLRARSGGICEWPDCSAVATDAQHRLGRKVGGRRGAARERLNGVAWLIHTCRTHHEFVTSPIGEDREQARRMGWLLEEYEDAAQVAVTTRHHPEPVWLDSAGGWHSYEEGVA